LADCELLATCPFFNLSIDELALTYKEQYCKGDYRWCGRYMAFKALERIKEQYAKAGHSGNQGQYTFQLETSPSREAPWL